MANNRPDVNSASRHKKRVCWVGSVGDRRFSAILGTKNNWPESSLLGRFFSSFGVVVGKRARPPSSKVGTWRTAGDDSSPRPTCLKSGLGRFQLPMSVVRFDGAQAALDSAQRYRGGVSRRAFFVFHGKSTDRRNLFQISSQP